MESEVRLCVICLLSMFFGEMDFYSDTFILRWMDNHSQTEANPCHMIVKPLPTEPVRVLLNCINSDAVLKSKVLWMKK